MYTCLEIFDFVSCPFFAPPSSMTFKEDLLGILKWAELRSTLAITFACTFGLLIALIDELYYPKSPVELEPKDVISAVLLVMDLGNAEKLYLSTMARMLGMISGVFFGVALSLIEESIWISYKDTKKERHEDDWKLILYKASVFAPIVFSCTLLMKRYPKLGFPIVVFAFQVPTGLFARNIRHAASKIMSSLAAAFVSILSIVIFERVNSTAILTEANERAIRGVIGVCEIAIEGDPLKVDEFYNNSETVHKALSQADSSITSYSQWRTYTCRDTIKDFSILSKPLGPLFYESFSLYWSNAQCYRATAYRAEILFCDSQSLYDQYFKADKIRVLNSLAVIKTQLSKFLSRQYFTDEITQSLLNHLVEQELWGNMYLSLDNMRTTYLDHRADCFSTFSQRWNVTHMLRRMMVIATALTNYVRSVSLLFLRDSSRRAEYDIRMEKLVHAFEDMRTSEVPGIRTRLGSDSTSSPMSNYSSGINNSPIQRDYFSRQATKGGL